jgi:hypothetical protein
MLHFYIVLGLHDIPSSRSSLQEPSQAQEPFHAQELFQAFKNRSKPPRPLLGFQEPFQAQEPSHTQKPFRALKSPFRAWTRN